MSGGGSKSTSKPTYTPQQIKVFEWMQKNVVPLAEGKETYLTQLMAQRARDEAAKLQGQQEQGLQNIAGATGMSAGQVGQSLQSQQSQAIQATLAQIMNQRMSTQTEALKMIGNIPMTPGQTETTKGVSPYAEIPGQLIGAGGKIGAAAV